MLSLTWMKLNIKTLNTKKGKELAEKMLRDFCTTRDKNASWKIVQGNRFWFTYLSLKSDLQFNILCYISMQILFWNRSESRTVVARRDIPAGTIIQGLKLYNTYINQQEEVALRARARLNFHVCNFHGSDRFESRLYVCMILFPGYCTRVLPALSTTGGQGMQCWKLNKKDVHKLK